MPEGVVLAAALDVRHDRKTDRTWWSGDFNTGVMLIRPSASFFAAVRDTAQTDRRHYRSDQELLNRFVGKNFSVLPHQMNANLALHRFMRPFWDRIQPVSIIHFTVCKPWSCGPRSYPQVAPIAALWKEVRRSLRNQSES